MAEEKKKQQDKPQLSLQQRLELAKAAERLGSKPMAQSLLKHKDAEDSFEAHTILFHCDGDDRESHLKWMEEHALTDYQKRQLIVCKLITTTFGEVDEDKVVDVFAKLQKLAEQHVDIERMALDNIFWLGLHLVRELDGGGMSEEIFKILHSSTRRLYELMQKEDDFGEFSQSICIRIAHDTAYELLKANMFELAFPHVVLLRGLEPKNVQHIWALGMCYINQDEYNDAIATFELPLVVEEAKVHEEFWHRINSRLVMCYKKCRGKADTVDLIQRLVQDPRCQEQIKERWLKIADELIAEIEHEYQNPPDEAEHPGGENDNDDEDEEGDGELPNLYEEDNDDD